MFRKLSLLLVVGITSTVAAQDAPTTQPAPTFGGNILSRTKLTGDWGGARDKWAADGFTVDLDINYIFQGVTGGGIPNTGHSTGNTISGDLVLMLDTTKAGLWPGGFFKTRLEGRDGQSVMSRAGTISSVNVDALFPNVPNRVDQSTWGLTELTYMQFLSEHFGLVGGLLNTLDGDANGIAGNARGNDSSLNMSFLLSPTESATAPNVTLGGGAIFIPAKNITGTLTIFGSSETATEDPFDRLSGTTFATEWTIKHHLGTLPGGQVVGFMYGINKSRADIALDPRVFIGGLVTTGTTPTTAADTWNFYYNAHQFIQGDERHGWGPFVRAGLSDGNPNPVRWNIASGVGGKGLISCRDADRWGVGIYYLDMSNAALLNGLHISDEVGGEIFYNFAITPAAHLTLDAQEVNSARPRQNTATVLGIRLVTEF